MNESGTKNEQDNEGTDQKVQLELADLEKEKQIE